jgi:hypothetical protein
VANPLLNAANSPYSGYSPVTIEVPIGQPVRLPNPRGQGGILITNKDSVYSVDVAPTHEFVTSQSVTVPAGLPLNWPEGAVWCRVTPGQSTVMGVAVLVQPAGAVPTPSTSALSQISIGDPPAGEDFVYTLEQTVRLVGFVAGLVPVGSTDLPLLLIGPSPFLNVLMSSAALPAGVESVLTGFEAAQLMYRTGDARGTFPLPNLFLAAGTVLRSLTTNLGASDQWRDITLWVSPS